MKKTLTALAIVLAFVLMAVPVTAAATNPKAFFASVSLEVYDWNRTAVYFAYDGIRGRTIYVDVNGNMVGAITNGMVDYTSGGYAQTEEDFIRAFNDYRGVAHVGYLLPDWSNAESLNMSAEQAEALGIMPDNRSGSGNGTAPLTQAEITRYRQQIINQVNAQRIAAGLHELQMHDDMMAGAQIRAEELVSDYSHYRLDGTYAPAYAGELIDGSQRGGGENIAKAYKTPDSVMSGWMGSTPHRNNILNENYSYIGVGCHEKDGKLYWVQLFSR